MSELHVSFKERDFYLDLLSQAYADGRLSDEDFNARRDRVLAATTHGEYHHELRGLPVPQPVPPESPALAVPRNVTWERRMIIAGGVLGVGFIGLAFLGGKAWDSSSTPVVAEGPAEAPLTEPPMMTGWEDWWNALDWLNAKGYIQVVDLTVAETSVTGTVALESNPATLTTTDGVLSVSDPAAASKIAPIVSLEALDGGYTVLEDRRQVQELWPPGAQVPSVRLLPGSDVKGAIEVSATRNGAALTVFFDAIGTGVTDVKEG